MENSESSIIARVLEGFSLVSTTPVGIIAGIAANK